MGKPKQTLVLPEQDAASLHFYLLTGAALQLLRSAMRRSGALAGRAPATLDLLDPLVPLLVSEHACMRRLGLRA